MRDPLPQSNRFTEDTNRSKFISQGSATNSQSMERKSNSRREQSQNVARKESSTQSNKATIYPASSPHKRDLRNSKPPPQEVTAVPCTGDKASDKCRIDNLQGENNNTIDYDGYICMNRQNLLKNFDGDKHINHLYNGATGNEDINICINRPICKNNRKPQLNVKWE